MVSVWSDYHITTSHDLQTGEMTINQLKTGAFKKPLRSALALLPLQKYPPLDTLFLKKYGYATDDSLSIQLHSFVVCICIFM